MAITKAKVIDTSTLVHDPSCLDHLIDNKILACVPWVVLEELDGLKKRTDVGFDAREAIRNLESLRRNKSPYLKIVKETDWTGIEFLEHRLNDHKIIAAANAMKKQFDNVEIISKDSMMRIKVRELGFKAEDYYKDQADTNPDNDLPRIEVSSDDIDKDDFTFQYSSQKYGEIPINQGVVCISDWRGDFKRPDETCNIAERFVAVRIDNQFKIVPNNIQAFGIRPYGGVDDANQDDECYDSEYDEGSNQSHNHHITQPQNWPQTLALFQLTRPDLALVFLEGGAGSGKTLFALAAALEKRRDYRQILITRPMVHLEDIDNMGFLPGNIKEKMDPWLRPIWQNLSVLKELKNDNMQLIDKMLIEKKIDIEPLDYIRGTTFWKSILIIDEAQNLTPHQVKTIITRAGVGTKIIFTGDLDQIDRKRRLDKLSSGLAYAISRLSGQRLVASIKFQTSVRSELAKLGVEML
ncbi:MAG: PhoH family protein [Desulfamplus sp.]|nr:PhoH family protein [Desulfamplus sp.]MBF0240950.1 PhoH family protein [Desulfamplus sp.]